ncbi:MAG: glycosyltransferase, partial [Cyclobacteriaceae bacterium]|nr:glycosyltransferase [Cyclobacteriaceae bacterium]
MDNVAVVILNFNGKNYLEKFLPSVVQYSSNCQIIVADNCSTDDSVAWVKEHYPQINLILLDKNYGFSHGYNEALKQVQSEYYVLLNSDVEVTENWINPIIELFEKNPQIAAAQPKILSWHSKKHFEYAGAAGGFIDILGYPFCRGRLFTTLEEDRGQYNDSRE